MKAAFITKTGPSNYIKYEALPVPDIKNNELLVKTQFVAVNPVDCYIRSGKYAIPLQFPYIIGRDFCGVVEKIGPKVTQFKPGDKVWSNCQGIHGRQGSFAEYLAVDERTVFHLPKNANPLEAIATFHSALTAVVGIFREAILKRGETIFINGGAGNVGSLVCQIASSLGAAAIVSASGEQDIQWCYESGAQHVIDYKATDVTIELKKLAPKGVDVFWNTTLVHDFEHFLPLLAYKGRYILMSGLGRKSLIDVGDLYTKDACIHGFAISNLSDDELVGNAEAINQLLSKNSIKSRIAHILPLSEAAAAHNLLENTKVKGKIILTLE
ncbi:NADPH:quinone reductase [Legionella micdadei]|uniref:NADPH:quinone reductase n=1 Tax=Legionella micdadei TaxID=451 RepID=UPI0009EF7C1D|nr:NADPH:quinone reductase [Legionella micdadei]ARH00429.1 hypothetical protein B6V88_08330 [Legionella micdadei]